jgi:two-component system phosphate regulon response regulator OmpR
MTTIAEIDALGRTANLLVVDDDARIRSLLQKFLSMHGASCATAADAAGARNLLDSLSFDLLILDVTMPGEDGFSLLSSLRRSLQLPVILLTARGLPEDRIHGLSLGADDYLAKPFEPEELLLRINAVLRRSAPPRDAAARFGPFTLDLLKRTLAKHGEPAHLTEAEAALLCVLARAGGAALAREEIARRANLGQERSVDVLVTRLRRKLESDARQPAHLLTVRGIGYRLALD